MYMCTYTHISDDITSTFQIQFLCLTPQNSNHPIILRRLGFFRNTFQQLFNNNVALQQENIRCFSLCWFWNLSSLKPLLESIYWSSTGPVHYTKRHSLRKNALLFFMCDEWWTSSRKRHLFINHYFVKRLCFLCFHSHRGLYRSISNNETPHLPELHCSCWNAEWQTVEHSH